MSLRAEIEGDWHAALAALCWQYDCGADEFVVDEPVNRYDLPETLNPPAPAARPAARGTPRKPAAPEVPDAPAKVDPVAEARALAARAPSLAALQAALSQFERCEVKKGARNTVFADGNPEARVLILGEAPGRDEDIEGRPFVGRAGQLLDQMFGAIGLTRDAEEASRALYITNVLPWRPPGNRDPEPAEIAMMQPFVERHISLANPEVIVALGNVPLITLTGQGSILKSRGKWMTALNRPLLPMVHPAYLLRNPAAKREAWADLLTLQARLRG
jgi:DNA polymerase